MTSLVARYNDGEFAAVWDELRRSHTNTREAEAVAAVTMQRVARNVDVIVSTLDAAGWRWAYPNLKRTRPSSKDLDAVGSLEQRIGPLPTALRACLCEVGEVWLCGTLPAWTVPAYAFDDIPGYPMMADSLVLPSASWMLEELTEWDSNTWAEPKRPWRFAFAPDELHKANISGSTHDMDLPDAAADPVIRGVEYREGITLVEYLRASMSYGGFPGAEFMSAPPGLFAQIAVELTPF